MDGHKGIEIVLTNSEKKLECRNLQEQVRKAFAQVNDDIL